MIEAGLPTFCEDGVRNIEDVQQGASVLGADGNYRPVAKAISRPCNAYMLEIQHSSTNGKLLVTPEHQLLVVRPNACTRMGGAICRPTMGCLNWCRRVSEKMEKRTALYESAMALMRTGKTLAETSRVTGLPETTLLYWNRGGKPKARPEQMPYCDHYVPQWIPTSDLRVGDFLVMPVPKGGEAISKVQVGDLKKIAFGERSGFFMGLSEMNGAMPVDDEFLRLCGLYVAEGCNNGAGGLAFNFSIDEENLFRWVRDWAKKSFGRNAFQYKRAACHAQVVHVSASPIGLVFEHWFGKGARNKRLPAWAMSLPADQLIHIITGLWHGDGCAMQVGKYGRLSYTTSSRTLAHQLWLCLARCGVKSYLVEKIAAQKAHNGGKLMYNLNVNGDDAMRLASMIGETLHDGRSDAAWSGCSFIHRGYVYSRVQVVTPRTHEGPVYSLSSEGEPSFVAQLVANSACGP